MYIVRTLCVYCQEERNWGFHASMVPFQSTPFLHYNCLPGRICIGHTTNLIKVTISLGLQDNINYGSLMHVKI